MKKPHVEVYMPAPAIRFGDGKIRVCCLECTAGAVEALSKKTWQQQRDFITKSRAFAVLVKRGGHICCAECGTTDWNVLQVDHKKGDGHKHRAKLGEGGVGAGMRTYRWILRNKNEARRTLMLLCANCHQLKTSKLL